MVFTAACAMVANSRSRPIQTLPKRSAIGACSSATSGLIAGSSTIGSPLENGLSITFQSARYFKTSEPISPRSGMKRRAGGVHHLDRARGDGGGETRRRAELAQAHGRSLQRLDAAGADQQI